MSPAVAPRRPRAAKKKASTARPASPMPWWGDRGPSPIEQWPGVTIDFPAVWRPLTGPVRRAVRRDADGDPYEVYLRADGKEIAACWAEDGGRWESPDGRYYFDRGAADRAVQFFPTFLVHHIGEWAGQPFELLDYQKKLLTRPICGWLRAIDGMRRIRKVFAFIPKGAGKSPFGAGTGIYLARCDNEPAAEVYAVAADRDNARTVHDNAKIMVENDEDLSESAEITKDAIVWTDTHSTYRVLSREASSKHGFRPHGVIFDEFHAQKNRDLYEALKKSMPKRRQPLMLIITHAGDDDESICFEEYEYAKGVLSGTIPDETCLPVIFEMSEKDDWTDPAVWARVNPGHGITIKHEGIASECLEAQVEPRKLNDFLRFHGNRWVNQATAWIPVDWWDACDEPLPSEDELRGCPAALGLDMAQKIDLAAAVAVFRLPLARKADALDLEVQIEEPDGKVVKKKRSLNYRVALVPAFWLPEDTLRERSKKDGIRYDVFAEQGLLHVTEGAIINSQDIVDYIKDDDGGGLVKTYPLLKQGQFGYDPAFATEIALDLRDQHGLQVVEVLQNYKHLSEACQVFEALVKAKRVVHGGHRLLRWCLENVAIKTDDAGRIRPVKPRKPTKRIDGIVAAIIGLSRLMVMPEPKKTGKRRARVWTPNGFVPVPGAAPAGGEHARP